MDFADVENAIVEELKGGVPGLRTVGSYTGQFEGGEATVKLPAAMVAYRGSSFEPVDGPSHAETAEFSVLVAARDLRGEEEARNKIGGAYELVSNVLSMLTNKTLGLDIERLRPVRTQLVFSGRGLAVYGVDFITSFDTVYEW